MESAFPFDRMGATPRYSKLTIRIFLAILFIGSSGANAVKLNCHKLAGVMLIIKAAPSAAFLHRETTSSLVDLAVRRVCSESTENMLMANRIRDWDGIPRLRQGAARFDLPLTQVMRWK